MRTGRKRERKRWPKGRKEKEKEKEEEGVGKKKQEEGKKGGRTSDKEKEEEAETEVENGEEEDQKCDYFFHRGEGESDLEGFITQKHASHGEGSHGRCEYIPRACDTAKRFYVGVTTHRGTCHDSAMTPRG